MTFTVARWGREHGRAFDGEGAEEDMVAPSCSANSPEAVADARSVDQALAF
jgi:hypothetical protein